MGYRLSRYIQEMTGGRSFDVLTMVAQYPVRMQGYSRKFIHIICIRQSRWTAYTKVFYFPGFFFIKGYLFKSRYTTYVVLYIHYKDKRKEIWIKGMSKSPENTKHRNLRQINIEYVTTNFDYTAIVDRLRLVSCNDSCWHGYPVYMRTRSHFSQQPSNQNNI